MPVQYDRLLEHHFPQLAHEETTMKKSKKDPKRLLLSTEKVRQLQPVSDDQLAGVAGGEGCTNSTRCSNTTFPS